jgi:hypothetical protein
LYPSELSYGLWQYTTFFTLTIRQSATQWRFLNRLYRICLIFFASILSSDFTFYD